MSKQLVYFIRFAFGLIILAILFYKLGFSNILYALSGISYIYLFPVFAFFSLSWVITTLNLQVLLLALGHKLEFKEMFRYMWASKAVTLVLPGKIGEFSMVAFLKDKGIGKVSALLIVDKIISLSSYIVIGVIGSALIFEIDLTHYVIGIILLAVAGMLALTPNVRKVIRKYVLRKYAVHFKGFTMTIFEFFTKHKKYVMANTILTLMRIVSTALSVFFIFLALNTKVELQYVVVISSIEILMGVLPITPEGVGIKQSVGVYLYSLAGVSAPVAGARYVVGLAERYIIGFFGVFFIKK